MGNISKKLLPDLQGEQIGIDKELYTNVRQQIKVYMLDCMLDEKGFNFRDLEMNGNELAIMQEAENRGTVYSLQEFQDGLNDEDLDTNNIFILIR
jgi:hypothetical protein